MMIMMIISYFSDMRQAAEAYITFLKVKGVFSFWVFLRAQQ